MMDITLITERLVLRPYTPRDFVTVHAYASDFENTYYMPFGPNSEQETWDFLSRKFEEYKEESPRNFDFAICLRDTGEHVGGGGIYLRDEHGNAELGWIIRKDMWGRGLCSEFCGAMLRFGFEDLKLHRIYARCNAQNHGSYRVMERNGMRREAHLVSARFEKVGDHKEWTDELTYAILADEWSAKWRCIGTATATFRT